MIKKGLTGTAVLAGILLSILTATGTFAAKEEISLDNAFGQVKFNHRKHTEKVKIHCIQCHHTWKKDDASGKQCAECHTPQTKRTCPSLRDAFHETCRGCHERLKQAKQPAGPTACIQCHNITIKKKE